MSRREGTQAVMSETVLPLPEMRPSNPPPHQGGGHGLRLVDLVADRWGVERGSTRVWFEIDA
jgi:hypothetical protein